MVPRPMCMSSSQPMMLRSGLFPAPVRFISLRAGVKNLLESDQFRAMTLRGKDYVYQRYCEGRIIGIGLNFSL